MKKLHEEVEFIISAYKLSEDKKVFMKNLENLRNTGGVTIEAFEIAEKMFSQPKPKKKAKIHYTSDCESTDRDYYGCFSSSEGRCS